MRNLAHKYCFLADTLSDWVGKTCMWSAAIGMLIMIYEVFTRYVFQMANDWVFETTIMIYAFHFCMCASYALKNGAHVAIDIVSGRCSLRTQAILDMISYIIFFFPSVGVVFFRGITFAADSWRIKEVSWSEFPAPIYLQKTIIPVMSGLLLIQGLAIFIRRIEQAIDGDNYKKEAK